MRVMLDTNILISYLLVSDTSSVIYKVVKEVITGEHVLVLPPGLLQEVLKKIPEKPYLNQRITHADFKQFITLIESVVEKIEPVHESIPRLLRDPKDDYLLFYALMTDVDYLVTGDDDLLSIGSVGNLHIVSPREFYNVL